MRSIKKAIIYVNTCIIFYPNYLFQRLHGASRSTLVVVGFSDTFKHLGSSASLPTSSSPLSPSRNIGHPQSASSESYSEPPSSPLPMSFLPFQFPLQLFFSKSVSVFLSAYSLEDSNLVQSSQLIHSLFSMYVLSNSISLFQI